jgi:hypothetical protein
MKSFVFASVILFAVSGCATSPITNKDAQPVPADRIFHTEKLPIEGNANVIFVRDVGAWGSGLYNHLFIDGNKAASLNPSEKVEFILAPGEHIFGVIPTDPFGQYTLHTIDQDLKPGKRYFYRISTDGTPLTTVQRFFPEAE